MAFTIYIVRGVRGHSVRFVLVVSFVALGVLMFQLGTALDNAFTLPIQAQQDDRLLVLNGVSPQMPLPTRYAEQIEKIEGVALVTHGTWMGAYFRHPGWMVPAIAVETRNFFTVNSGLHVADSELASWGASRDGVLVDRRFADRYNLSVGDRLPLQTSIWQLDRGGILDLRIVGTVVDDDAHSRPAVYLNYEYLDRSRLSGKGLTSYFLVRPASGVDSGALALTIDAVFADQIFQGITQTASVQLHMKLLASRLFDFGRTITFVNICICALLSILLASNLYVVAQKSIPDYHIFYRLGFSRPWVLGTAFLQLGSYVLVGVVVGGLLGAAAVQLVAKLSGPTLMGFGLSTGDHLRLLLIGCGLTVVATLPALGRLAFTRLCR
jgi:putative ABC transport system permease protein